MPRIFPDVVHLTKICRCFLFKITPPPPMLLQLVILFLPVYNMNVTSMLCTVGAASLGFFLWPLLQVSLDG